MLNLESGESIILEVRKHWFVFLWNTLGLFVGVAVPILVYFILLKFGPVDIVSIILKYKTEYGSLVMFFYYLWILGLWIIFFVQWTNYYLDVWYVTQKRIIDVNQKSIFHREVSNLRFDKIQDISIEVNGFIATMLNFGDIKVQTAAEDSSEFLIRNARNPERVRRIIFGQHNTEAEKPMQVTIEE